MKHPSAVLSNPTPEPGPQFRPEKSVRDHRLDFWRGLCLIDMLLVHLVHQGLHLGHRPDLWIGEYTRFAAGGFVFIAGLSIARIFLPRAQDPDRRWPTYLALWRRSAVILLVHYIAEIGFLLMWPLFDGFTFIDIWAPIRDILLLRSGYDLLPFYVVMVALAPVMLELIRRRLWWVLAIASLGIFVSSHLTGAWALYSLPIQHDFYPSLWQIIFVAGLLGGLVLPWYDRFTPRTKVIAALAAWVVHGLLFVAYYGPDFGMYLNLGLIFAKVPLSGGETLRYLSLILALIFTTDLLWKRWLDGTAVAGFNERLGRNSLPVYVFHVWLVQIAVRTQGLFPSVWGRLALAIVTVGLLWGFARLLEMQPTRNKKKQHKASGEPKPWIPVYRRSIGSLPSLAICSVVAVILANEMQERYPGRPLRAGEDVPSPTEELLTYDREDGPLLDVVPDPDNENQTNPFGVP